MAIDDKDILQMDATIIAGALVLLTVSSIATGSPISQRVLISIASVLIINFGLSAMSILWKNKRDHYILFALGALIVVMFIIMIFNLITIFLPPPEGEDSKIPSGNLSSKGTDGIPNNNKNYSSISLIQDVVHHNI